MIITATKEGNINRLDLAGRVEASSVQALRDEVQKLVQDGSPFFVFDMGGITFIDSSGLGVLVASLRTVNKIDGDIRVANLLPEVRSVFELTRMHRLFEIYPSSEAAIASYA